jgi:hypothetical protein
MLTCVRDYNEVIMSSTSRFAQGWIAPKIVTSENQDEVAGIQPVSGAELGPLICESRRHPRCRVADLSTGVEIAMHSSDMHSWDPTLYPTAILGYFLLYYACAHLLTL